MKALRDAVTAGAKATNYWGDDVTNAASEAGKAGYIPVNAALEAVMRSKDASPRALGRQMTGGL